MTMQPSSLADFYLRKWGKSAVISHPCCGSVTLSLPIHCSFIYASHIPVHPSQMSLCSLSEVPRMHGLWSTPSSIASRSVDTRRPVISPAELSALGPPRAGASASISSMKTTAGAAARAAAKTPCVTGRCHQQLGHGRKQSRHQVPSHPSFRQSCLQMCQHICDDHHRGSCSCCYRGDMYSRAGQIRLTKGACCTLLAMSAT